MRMNRTYTILLLESIATVVKKLDLDLKIVTSFQIFASFNAKFSIFPWLYNMLLLFSLLYLPKGTSFLFFIG